MSAEPHNHGIQPPDRHDTDDQPGSRSASPTLPASVPTVATLAEQADLPGWLAARFAEQLLDRYQTRLDQPRPAGQPSGRTTADTAVADTVSEVFPPTVTGPLSRLGWVDLGHRVLGAYQQVRAGAGLDHHDAVQALTTVGVPYYHTAQTLARRWVADTLAASPDTWLARYARSVRGSGQPGSDWGVAVLDEEARRDTTRLDRFTAALRRASDAELTAHQAHPDRRYRAAVDQERLRRRRGQARRLPPAQLDRWRADPDPLTRQAADAEHARRQRQQQRQQRQQQRERQQPTPDRGLRPFSGGHAQRQPNPARQHDQREGGDRAR